MTNKVRLRKGVFWIVAALTNSAVWLFFWYERANDTWWIFLSGLLALDAVLLPSVWALLDMLERHIPDADRQKWAREIINWPFYAPWVGYLKKRSKYPLRMTLGEELKAIIKPDVSESRETYQNFQDRLKEGTLTREENERSHFCIYFLPYNTENKEVLFVSHKKSSLWLSPGGHIDKGETLLQTLNREIGEELGVKNYFPLLPNPFLLTITNIPPSQWKIRPCQTHYDIWYLLETDGKEFNINPEEFHETKWLSIDEAKEASTDDANRKALEIIQHT